MNYEWWWVSACISMGHILNIVYKYRSFFLKYLYNYRYWISVNVILKWVSFLRQKWHTLPKKYRSYPPPVILLVEDYSTTVYFSDFNNIYYIGFISKCSNIGGIYERIRSPYPDSKHVLDQRWHSVGNIVGPTLFCSLAQHVGSLLAQHQYANKVNYLPTICQQWVYQRSLVLKSCRGHCWSYISLPTYGNTVYLSIPCYLLVISIL